MRNEYGVYLVRPYFTALEALRNTQGVAVTVHMEAAKYLLESKRGWVISPPPHGVVRMDTWKRKSRRRYIQAA